MGTRGEDLIWVHDDVQEHGSDPVLDSDNEEDSDNQQELEEMLYSKIHYDDASIRVADTQETLSPSVSVCRQSSDSGVGKDPPKLGFAAPGISEPIEIIAQPFKSSPGHVRNSQLLPSFKIQPFSRPRPKSSRYYDKSLHGKEAIKCFAVPRSPWAAKLLEANCASPVKANTSSMKNTSVNEKTCRPHNLKEMTMSNTEPILEVISSKTNLTVAADLENMLGDPPLSAGNNSGNSPLTQNESQEETLVHDKTDSSPSLERSPKQAANLPNESKEMNCVVSPCQKRTKLTTSKSIHAKKKRQEILEAESSRVLNSMFDEESRSSMDGEPSPVRTRASRARNTGTLKMSTDGGWSVGMSWDDMSAKYSFEVDSVDEESLCSFQMRDGSTPAGSRTTTPDLRENHVTAQDKTHTPESADVDEPSRYSMNLRQNDNDNSKEEDTVENSSDSEVGSVVELAVPQKPPPPVVELLSDGDDDVILKKSQTEKRATPDMVDPEEITVLYTKPIIEVDITHSDDDLLIINTDVQGEDLDCTEDRIKLNTDISSTSNSPLQEDTDALELFSKINKTKVSASKLLDKINQTPEKKRQAQLQRLKSKATPQQKRSSVDSTLPFTIGDEISSMNDNDESHLWLMKPIEASQHMDHKFLLDKMPENPHLWQLCPEDKFQSRLKRSSGPKCINCKCFGHKLAHCPEPRKITMCHMCGAPGHSWNRCPSKMCLKCGTQNGSIYSSSCASCRKYENLVCQICKHKGHCWQKCPDLWRRYHLTINTESLVQPMINDVKPSHEIWCSNCAQRGHSSHVCSAWHWHCEEISPFISSYLAPAEEECQVLGGVSSACILLTNEDAILLESDAGDGFLAKLAASTHASIHLNTETAVKKLRIEASPLVQEKVRSDVKEWIQSMKRPQPLTVESEKLDTVSSDVSCTGVTCNLPKNPQKLIAFLRNELNRLSQLPIKNYEDMSNVYSLYSHFLAQNHRNGNRKALQHARLLHMYLLGKLGYARGHYHVNALQEGIRKLSFRAGNHAQIREELMQHYTTVFTGYFRKDLDELVAKCKEAEHPSVKKKQTDSPLETAEEVPNVPQQIGRRVRHSDPTKASAKLKLIFQGIKKFMKQAEMTSRAKQNPELLDKVKGLSKQITFRNLQCDPAKSKNTMRDLVSKLWRIGKEIKLDITELKKLGTSLNRVRVL